MTDPRSVNRNLLASFLGNAWTAIVQIAFIPVYIRLLGIEAFGLIGVYAFLQMAIVLLDLGMTPTMNREVSVARAGTRSAASIRDLLRTLEIVLLCVATALVFFGEWIAPWLGGRWLRLESLPPSSAIDALRLMAALIAVRVFMGVHRGAIAGAQEFVWFNVATAAFATLRAVGAIPLLWWKPTVEAFFAYQLAVTVLESAVLWRKAWSLVPGGGRPSFCLLELRGVRRFAGGMAALSAVSLVVSQADKVVASTLLPLSEFGYYALASSVASALVLFLAPIGSVAYPRLSGIAATGGSAALKGAFHEMSQLAAMAIAPAALVLAAFSHEVLLLWTGEAVASRAAAPLLEVLAIATMLNGLLQVPFLLLVIRGNTLVPAAVSGALALVFIPALYLGVSADGGIAAAYAWLVLNVVLVAVFMAVPQRDLPWSERRRWLLADSALPVSGALVAIGAVHVLALAAPLGAPPSFWPIALSAAGAATGSVLATKAGRIYISGLAARLTGPRK